MFAENWTEIAMCQPTDEEYHAYDLAVARTISVLMDRSPYNKAIYLRGFNRKRKDHLFILRIALMVRDLTQVPVEIECSWWDSVVVNWKIRKGFKKIKRLDPWKPGGFWVSQIINKIECEVKEEVGFKIYLDEVYDAYYEGSCG